YIRVLGEDIGAVLGCGAHLQALRRTGGGRLSLAGAVTLEQLEGLPEAGRTAALAPVDALLPTFSALTLPDNLAHRLRQGQRLALGREGLPLPAQGRVRLYRAGDGALLGTGQLKEGAVLAPERLTATV